MTFGSWVNRCLSFQVAWSRLEVRAPRRWFAGDETELAPLLAEVDVRWSDADDDGMCFRAVLKVDQPTAGPHGRDYKRRDPVSSWLGGNKRTLRIAANGAIGRYERGSWHY